MATDRPVSSWIAITAVIAGLSLAVGCSTDKTTSTLNSEPLRSDSDKVFESEPSTAEKRSDAWIANATSAVASRTPSVDSDTQDPRRPQEPAAGQSERSGVAQSSPEKNAAQHDEALLAKRSPTEVADLNRILISVGSLDEAIHPSSGLKGDPLRRDGPAPMAVVAATGQCELVFIDARTLEAALIWDYGDGDDRYFDCGDFGAEEPLVSGENARSHIESIEWVYPSLVLVSLCCEPAVGRFEVIDTSNDRGPFWLSLNGGSPSLNEDNVLLYSLSSYLGGRETSVIGSVEFDAHLDASDPEYPFYSIESEPALYALSAGPDHATGIHGFVSDVSWVGEDKIAFELWAQGPSSNLHPFIGLIDLESNTTMFGSRNDGWTLPSGDGSSNLVVVEQRCNRFNSMTDDCASDGAKIVVLDANSLAPTYEMAVDDNVADMDLHRGWLLVTFRSGRMGVLDLADGSFSLVADQITNAGWVKENR